MASALGFFCFLPYPALNVGNASALQIGNLLCLLAVAPALALPWRGRPLWMTLLILAPLCLSAFKAALLGGGDAALSLKSVVLWGVTCLAVLATQLHAPRHAPAMLTGIAAATLLHAAVGLWQLYSFASGEFPLVQLYVNQSFMSVQDNARIIARWTQRPFGIFPEPSAMSSSLAPWVLFWVAELAGLVRLRRRPAPWQRWLFGAAAAGGTALILVSRSGHAAVTLAGVMLLSGLWFARRRATLRTFLGLVGVFGVVLPLVLWMGAAAISDRVGGKSEMGNSSWEERSASMRIGLTLFATSDPPTLLCGMGAGLSAPIMQEVAHLEAVFSTLLTYVCEAGLVGIAALAIIGGYLLRVWKSLRWEATFAAFLVVWFVGITITTSYYQLLPLWVALGWMSVWPELCEGRASGVVPPPRGGGR